MSSASAIRPSAVRSSAFARSSGFSTIGATGGVRVKAAAPRPGPVTRSRRDDQQITTVAVLHDHRLDDYPGQTEAPLPYACPMHAVSS
jgi:hypothetical protein